MSVRFAGRRIVSLVLTTSIAWACADAPTTLNPTGTPGSIATPSLAPTNAAATPDSRFGGTLRVAGLPDYGIFEDPDGKRALDPQFDTGEFPWELFRCCLLRTLMSYSGRSAAEGGARLQPDLAAAAPEVSADGLTWTFRLKAGLRYGPPLEETEIVAADIIRALERTLTVVNRDEGLYLGGYFYYYEPVIQGAAAFSAGDAERISGLEAPDARTLVVRLTAPNGQLGHLFSLAATAPIPPHPTDPSAKFGIATGFAEGFGYRLVSSGPYMLEGSEALDFSRPPSEQAGVSGWIPGASLVLVRNPSWDRASDALRPAYVDRIEYTVGYNPLNDPPERLEELWAAVDRGEYDLLLDIDTPPDRVSAALADPARADRVHVVDADLVTMLPLNLAQPPLDDVHIRRAIAYAIDRAALIELRSPIRPIGPFAGRVHHHLTPDSLLDNLLLRYEPFPSAGGAGDLEAAMREVALSIYDTDRDGVCDAPACRSVLTLVNPRPGTNKVAAAIVEDLRPLGIELKLENPTEGINPVSFFERLVDPLAHIAMAIDLAFFKDYPNADSFFVPQFYRGSTDAYWNPSAIGVRPDELQKYGYAPLDIPNVDARIQACHALFGAAQVECWAEFDQYMTEQLVVAIPFGSFQATRVVSDRIVDFSFDQFTATPALDQISLRPG